jgi:hypothetical protein
MTPEEIAEQIGTENRFMVAKRLVDGAVLIMRPAHVLSRGDALNLAAYLVAIADDDDELPALLRAVQNT